MAKNTNQSSIDILNKGKMKKKELYAILHYMYMNYKNKKPTCIRDIKNRNQMHGGAAPFPTALTDMFNFTNLEFKPYEYPDMRRLSFAPRSNFEF